MPLTHDSIPSNDVRLPRPRAGTAVLVERYRSGEVKAVILHPDDFEQLQAGSEALDELVAAPAEELTDTAAAAHRLAESPQGELISDEASVKRLLGI